jgi:hypothetical protein
LGKSRFPSAQAYSNVSRGHEVSMVIEDDALFIPSRLDRVKLDVLPAGWHIAFLNAFVENGRPRRRISGHLCHGDVYAGSTAAYLLSRNGAQRLAAELAGSSIVCWLRSDCAAAAGRLTTA